jgi:hypothetical protein
VDRFRTAGVGGDYNQGRHECKRQDNNSFAAGVDGVLSLPSGSNKQKIILKEYKSKLKNATLDDAEINQ